MREPIHHWLLIIAVAAVVFFFNLGQPRLWDRDEPRNAGCAAEMMARGDLVVPTFNDQLRQHKPILLYWLMMSAYSMFGVTEFAARFWSAMLATGTLMATYIIARHLFDRAVGLMSAVVLGTSLMFVVAARAATPDSVLIFCGTIALMLFVLGSFRRNAASSCEPTKKSFFPASPLIVVAMYAAMGFGVLAKGPVGFLLPMAMIGLYGLIVTRHCPAPTDLPESSTRWQRLTTGCLAIIATSWQVVRPSHFFRTLWAMRPLTAAAIILLIAAPWFVFVHLQTEGDFTRRFFIGEHFGRATVAMENHGGGLWFYPVAILIGFFPWSCFWGPTVLHTFLSSNPESGSDANVNRGINERELGRKSGESFAMRAKIFLVCWVGVQVGAFSIAETKLPSYVTPCYPALAILTSSCLIGFSRSPRVGSLSITGHRRDLQPIWFFLGFGALVCSGLAISIGGWLALDRFLPELTWLAWLGIIPLITGLWLFVDHAMNSARTMLGVLSMAAILFAVGLFSVGTVSVDREQQNHQLMARIQAASDDVRVASYGCLESSWVFYGQKPITELIVKQHPSETEALAQQDRRTDLAKPEQRKFWKPVPWELVPEFTADGPALILTTDEHLDSLLHQLPADYGVLESAPYFLKQDRQLHLVGQKAPVLANQDSGIRR